LGRLMIMWLYSFLFFNGLFSNAISSSGNRMINEQWIVKDVEENSHCLFQGTIHMSSAQAKSKTVLAHYFFILNIYVPPQHKEIPHI
jgi:hypothetical protein